MYIFENFEIIISSLNAPKLVMISIVISNNANLASKRNSIYSTKPIFSEILVTRYVKDYIILYRLENQGHVTCLSATAG